MNSNDVTTFRNFFITTHLDSQYGVSWFLGFIGFIGLGMAGWVSLFFIIMRVVFGNSLTWRVWTIGDTIDI